MKAKLVFFLVLTTIFTSSLAYAAATRIKFNEYADSGRIVTNLFNFEANGATWTRETDLFTPELVDGYVTLTQGFVQELGERAVIFTDALGAGGAGCPSDFIIMEVYEPENGTQKIEFTVRSSDAPDFNELYLEILQTLPYVSTLEIDGTKDATPYLYSNPLLVNFEQHDVDSVPEPSTFALLGLGLGGIAFMRRRNK